VQGAKAGDKVLTELPIPERLREGLDRSDLGAAVGNFLFAQLAQRFIHGVRTGQPVTPSFFEGLKSQEMLDAIVQSAAEQRWVEL
jgi:predicted dehydrogenase